MNNPGNDDYAPLAKWLHWLVAALILVQYLLIQLAEYAEDADLVVKQLSLIANHKSIGITILLIAIVRVVFRHRNTPPELPTSMPHWQVTASNTSHFLLYFCLFSLPLSGWLMSSANAYSVSWFNLVPLPDLINADKQHAQLLISIHQLLSEGLVILAAVHALAALKHHIIDKDTVLTRMLNKASIMAATLLVIILSISLGGLTPNKQLPHKSPNQAEQTVPLAPAKTQTTHAESTLPIWDIDYVNSHIQFTGEQAGAPFTGRWQQWYGKLQFQRNKLERSRFDVGININSVSSNDDERDQTILSSDFFDVLKFPEARFQASNFSATSDGFLAKGVLTMKEISQPANLTFQVSQSNNNVILKGTATLNRHTWQLGINDWTDPTWVGSNVKVNVVVAAKGFTD